MARSSYPIVLLVVASLVGCDSSVKPASSTPAAAPYSVIVATRVEAPEERSVEGRVEGVRQAIITAQTAGQITEVVNDTGARVASGAVVVRIKSTQQTSDLARATAALSAARAQAVDAESRYKRMSELFARKAVARSSFEEATARRDSTAAQVNAAEAGLQAAREGLAYASARTPFDGVVTDRYVQVGTVVAPGAPLYAIAETHALRVTANIPQDFAERITQGSEISVYVNDRRFTAIHTVVHPRAGEASGSFGLRAELPSDIGGLYPGSIVRLGLATGRTGRLMLPTSAIVHREEIDGAYVFDPNNGGRTSFRNLRLGHQHADHIEVLAGLEAGEQVASDPAVALRQLQGATSQ